MSIDSAHIRQAIERVRELPTLPAVLGQMIEAANDPDTSAVELARHISADQSVAALLLRLVNSAYYGFHRQIDSVSQAIVILGFAEVRNLVLTASAFSAMPASGSSYDRSQLWRHSLATAMASERIARTLGWASDRGFYTAGLLHDIGKVTLDVLFPAEYEAAVHRAQHESLCIRDVERAVFELDHTEVGAYLAEHWQLPEDVVLAIRYHHNPVFARDEGHVASLVAYADFIAYQAGMGDGGNGAPPELPNGVTNVVRLEDSHVEHILGHIEKARESIDLLLGAIAC